MPRRERLNLDSAFAPVPQEREMHKIVLLRARARVAKANVELKAITERFPKKQMIRAKLDELRSASGDRWEASPSR